jgi:DNA modification methylase
MINDWKSAFPSNNRYFETENGILYCGDCLEILKQLEDASVDLIVTDPPYGINSHEQNGINYKDNFYNVGLIAKELHRVLKDNSRAYVFTAQKTIIDVIQGFEDNKFSLHQTVIWFRPNLAGGTRKKTYDFTSVYEQILNFHKGKPQKIKKVEGFNNFDVLKFTQPQSNFKKDKRYHIHQKPLQLIEQLIRTSSTENDIILDCYNGSGTTSVVSESVNRRWIGVELNPDYCEIAKQRILQVKIANE